MEFKYRDLLGSWGGDGAGGRDGDLLSAAFPRALGWAQTTSSGPSMAPQEQSLSLKAVECLPRMISICQPIPWTGLHGWLFLSFF